MSYFKQFFESAYNFQEARIRARERYGNRMKDLERHRGSRYYQEQSDAAQAEYDGTLTALKREYGPKLDSILAGMREANHNRPMTAPSEEQERIIRMLGTKKSVTREDLNSAAVACKDSPLALSLLDELARDREVVGFSSVSHADPGNLSTATVSRMIDNLADSTRDFLAFDTERSARLAAAFHANKYGVETDESTMPTRPRFTTDEAFYQTVAGLSGDALRGFRNAVDG